MMQQIAQTMEHLAVEGITHRNLAARNVLLFDFDKDDVCKTLVKVTDFASSDINFTLCEDGHVCADSTLALANMPVRWMSPEALQVGLFSEKS